MQCLRTRHKEKPFTVVLAAIGHHQTSRLLEQKLQEFNAPVVFTWTTRGAAAGVVLTTMKDVGSYADYHRLHTEGKLPALPEDGQLPNRHDRGCANPALPAAPTDTREVANQAARTVVGLALGQSVTFLQMWTHKPHGRFPGLAWLVRRLQEIDTETARRPVPEEFEVKRVELTYPCTLEIEKCMRHQSNFETGGVLFGRVTEGVVRVETVTGPGPQALRTTSTFAMDDSYAQGWLDAMYKLAPQQEYLGEWHSHPGASLKPSLVDERSALILTNAQGTHIDVPVLLICKLSASGDFEGKAFALQPSSNLQEVELLVLKEIVTDLSR